MTPDLPLSRRLCVLITSDPRSSPRAAEALRIAAGLCAGRGVEVTVCLDGPAIHALSDDADDLVDAAKLELSWPILRDSSSPVRVPCGSAEVAGLGEARVPFLETTRAELARLLLGSTYVLRF